VSATSNAGAVPRATGCARKSSSAGLPFSISEIEEACPGVSRDMVRVVLRAMKAEGLIAPTGKGRAAKWTRTGSETGATYRTAQRLHGCALRNRVLAVGDHAAPERVEVQQALARGAASRALATAVTDVLAFGPPRNLSRLPQSRCEPGPLCEPPCCAQDRTEGPRIQRPHRAPSHRHPADASARRSSRLGRTGEPPW